MQTFIIRVWAPPAAHEVEANGAPLRGVLEHVDSGGSKTFQSSAELLELIGRLARRAPERATASPD